MNKNTPLLSNTDTSKFNNNPINYQHKNNTSKRAIISCIDERRLEKSITPKKSIKNSCQHCNSTSTRLHQTQEKIPHKGKTLQVTQQLSICDSCNKEFTNKAQNLLNATAIRDAIKFSDGLLSSKEIYQARTSLGLTQEKAALVFGGGRNAFSKYERAEVSQSVSMDRLIRVCLEHPAVYEELLIKAGIEPIKTRANPIQNGEFGSTKKLEPMMPSTDPIQFPENETTMS